MAKRIAPVRLKKTNPVVLLVGLFLFIFVVVFLVSPSTADLSTAQMAFAVSHPLSPPTSPFRKAASTDDTRPPPVSRYNLNNITTTKNPIENRESILILTPMARFYQEFWDNLLKLDYPHELITLGFILPKNKEGNAATAALQEQIAKTQKHQHEELRFRSIIILHQDFSPPLVSQNEAERHKLSNQKVRRAAMAKARNSLLFTTLGPSISWVLWLDADIVETPPTLIQDMAWHDKPIIAPNCFQRYFNTETNKMDERPYDYNNWQDSAAAQELAAKMSRDDIIVEGYAELPTYRSLMAHMNLGTPDIHEEVPLDGVGGAVLLVKADVHRDGAMFPPFPFYNLIESEGFAKMAKRLGYQPSGLPNYRVYHYDE